MEIFFQWLLKNIFDWCTRIHKRSFSEQTHVIVGNSPGGRGGITVLELAKGTFPRFGAEVKGSFSLILSFQF
jgi:NAD(P)H-dependent FMN reductase